MYARLSNLFQDSKKIQWLIFILATIVYLNTIPNKWAVDDSIIIHQNNYIKKGFNGIGDIFTHDAFSGFYGTNINAVSGGRYRPLSQAVFAIEAELFAHSQRNELNEVIKDREGNKVLNLDANTLFPNILHFFNVLFYGLLCLVIYRTLLILFHSKFDLSKAHMLSFMSTLLFTVHPIHTEVVANVKSLDEILCLTGAMLTLLFLFKRIDETKQKSKWFFWSILSYSLALLSKETAVTFVAIIPLALWTFTELKPKSIVRLTVPFFLTLTVFLGIRTIVLYSPNTSEVAEELMNDPFLVLDENAEFKPIVDGSNINILINPSEKTFEQMPWTNKLATNIFTFGVYIKLLFVPAPLTIDYYPRHIPIKNLSNPTVILILFAHLTIIVMAFILLFKRHIIAFGILFYLITFSIVSNLIFPIGTNMAERFMFTPSLGFCILIGFFAYKLITYFNLKNQLGKKLTYYTFTAALLLFSVLTIDRNFDWKDNYTLFSNDAQVSQNSGKIQRDLAIEYITKATLLFDNFEKNINSLSDKEIEYKAGQIEQERYLLLTEAIKLLNQSLQIHPISNLTWFQMAYAHHQLSHLNLPPESKLRFLEIAAAAYVQADIYKSNSVAQVLPRHVSECYMDLGKLYGQHFGKTDNAIIYLSKANQLSPENPEILLLLGTAYSMAQDYQNAIAFTQKSYKIKPNDVGIKENLAIAYQQYAFTDTTQKALLLDAEELFIEIYLERKALPNSHPDKNQLILRTLLPLYENYKEQGNISEQKEVYSEIIKYDSTALEH